LGPGVLTEILQGLPNVYDPNLMIGFDTSDDACVYRVTDDIAAIHTVDFFTPIVDDPYQFGQIAAANALSDVYAMGGRPAVGMNLLCVPNCLSKETIRGILMGGHDKAVEAHCVIAGGHTIQDPEPKYGLCVTGYVHPDKVLRNVGARPGDLLVLTKPVGTGVITTAAKAQMVDEANYKAAVANMAALNAAAAEQMLKFDCIHACTDVTGFGLLGHAYEMAEGSKAAIRLFSGEIPLLGGAKELAEMGILPAGTYRNMDYVKPHLTVASSVPQVLTDLIADPQTSGGLLIALPAEQARELTRRLDGETPCGKIIGEILPLEDHYVEIV
jgi:selenide,water dikinase